MGDVNQGTQFWGQHAPGHGELPPVTPLLRIPAAMGSIVLFDIRLWHHGTPNQSSETARPIIYLSYVHDWYKDMVNFKQKQTRGFDALPLTSLKKLFSRVDSRSYT